MKNEEYNIKLAAYIEQLQELRKEAVSLVTGIIGETLCMDDLFFCASVDRCIRLIDGLIPMLKDRNLTCVGVLLRMQMDNCMRTYAAVYCRGSKCGYSVYSRWNSHQKSERCKGQ